MNPSGTSVRGATLPRADFTCWRCGACCRAPGEVRIDAAETAAMAACLGLDVAEMTARYTMLRPDRRGLILREQPDGACILLRPDGDCAVNAVKPKQCRDFPHGWNYPGWETQCANTCAWPRTAAEPAAPPAPAG